MAKHRMKASPKPIEKPDELKPLDLGQMNETALTALGQIRKSNALGTSLASWAQQNGIHFIDPVSDFRSREQAGEKLYYYYDGHCTRKGHAAAGNLIEKYLRAEQLISSD